MKALSKLYLFVTFLFFLVACGGGGSSSSTSTNNSSGNANNTTNTANKLNLSGTIELSSIASSGKRQKADPTNYYLWIQSRGTKDVLFTPLNSDGTYSLSIDNNTATTQGNNYFMGIVSINPFRFMGTIMQLDTSNSSQGFTGLELTGDISDFNINFDLDKGYGDIPDSLSNLTVSQDLIARLKDGKTVGVSSSGKDEDSKSSTLNVLNIIDQDEDGVPDIFDAMNNGKDLDNTDSNNASESVLASSSLESAIMFMNLKLDTTQAASINVADQAIVVIEVKAKDASAISSVVAKTVHSNFQNGVLDRIPGGFTAVDTWGAEGSLWKDDSYKLYKVTNEKAETAWTVLFRPKSDFNAGDLVLLEVTKTDGSTENVWVSINFKFNSTITDTTTWLLTGDGTRNTPYHILDTGGRVFTYEAPKDETGTALAGLEYSFEMFWYDASELQLGSRDVTTLGTDILTGQIPQATIDSHAGSTKYMQVDLTARYAYGDNCALLLYMKRESW